MKTLPDGIYYVNVSRKVLIDERTNLPYDADFDFDQLRPLGLDILGDRIEVRDGRAWKLNAWWSPAVSVVVPEEEEEEEYGLTSTRAYTDERGIPNYTDDREFNEWADRKFTGRKNEDVVYLSGIKRE